LEDVDDDELDEAVASVTNVVAMAVAGDMCILLNGLVTYKRGV